MQKKINPVLMVLFAVVFMLSGCAGWSNWTIPDDANSQMISYAAGKGVGAAVNKYVPKVDKPLGEAWGNMMVANDGADPIPAERVVAFYQEAIALIGGQSKDPYGIISDLTMVLSIYGGSIQYNDTGGMVLVLSKPIPLKVAKAFELGYKSGKSAVLNYAAK